MSRFIKQMMVREYQVRFRDVSELAVINVQGNDVKRMTEFRRSLRGKGFRAMVVKNRLCRQALAAAGLDAAAPLLEGPSTLVWGGQNIVEIAKTLAEQARALAAIEVRGGFAGGRLLSSEDMDALSKMPSRTEVLAEAVGRAIGQAARVVALAVSSAGRLLAQVREHEKRAPAGGPEPGAEKTETGKAQAAPEAAPGQADQKHQEAGRDQGVAEGQDSARSEGTETFPGGPQGGPGPDSEASHNESSES